MNEQSISRYNAPYQLEPLIPADAVLAPPLEWAGDLTRQTTALRTESGQAAQSELRQLSRSVNSYYTNRIEGEHTRCPAAG